MGANCPTWRMPNCRWLRAASSPYLKKFLVLYSAATARFGVGKTEAFIGFLPHRVHWVRETLWLVLPAVIP